MAKTNKNSFVFYETFYESIKELEKDLQHKFLIAIIKYGLFDEEPEFTGIEKGLWVQISFAIKEAKSKRKRDQENGAKGGNAKQANRTEQITDSYGNIHNVVN